MSRKEIYFTDQTPSKKELYGLDEEFKTLKAFAGLVWSDQWKNKSQIYAFNPTVLLFGSPGTGKTSLIKNLACEFNIAKYLSFSLERLLSKNLGESSKHLCSLFEQLREEAEAGKKILLHLDDAESCLSSRGLISESSGIRRFVTTFIKQLDILQSLNVEFLPIIAVTTNTPEIIDHAVLRRFSIKLEIGNKLDENTLRSLLDPIFKDLKISSDNMDFKKLNQIMIDKSLMPYDVYIVAQRLLMNSLTGKCLNEEAVYSEFRVSESSVINKYDNQGH
jgi:SpoVK/Ycf46/Vps4 family AAA+-type ATPase